MKMLKPHPTLGRNDFDLSHRTVHTANFGELIPSLCVETVPGDKIKVRVSDLVRAQPMVTSPFLRAKQHVDVWFVPYNMMWSRFNEFISDKDEPSSSALHDRLFVPHADLSDVFSELSFWHGNNYTSVHGEQHECIPTIVRNLDLLGIPGTFINEIITQSETFANCMPDLRFNLWRLAAFNLIWYREYRQQYYDDGKLILPNAIQGLSNGASYLFNFDWLQCSSEATSNLGTQSSQILAAMMQPRYRCWKKDIFTGLMPSTQFGNVSVVDSSISSSYTGLLRADGLITKDVTTRYVASSSGGSPTNATNIPSSGGTNGDWSTQFDILSLRKSEAVQRWRENALRAGNQIEDNFEAHYGVKPKSHLQVHPQFVASFDAPLNIGDINAQAQTGESINGILGDVAGKGIMSFDGSSEFTFETTDFGVLMGIYSILPEAEYNATNLDRMNSLLERQDYFTPEYENLGLEGVAKSVITVNGINNPVMGYAPRYFGYKQKHDRCTGDFMYFGFGSAGYLNGQFRPWCSPKYDVDYAFNQLPKSALYVNPHVFDVNFNVDCNTVNQFMVDFYSNVEAIRHMTVSGMPGY